MCALNAAREMLAKIVLGAAPKWEQDGSDTIYVLGSKKVYSSDVHQIALEEGIQLSEGYETVGNNRFVTTVRVVGFGPNRYEEMALQAGYAA